ncbi:MAG: helix-hairpin-helix domain-containing protein, partial [Kiritimatiellae bacterium]|nr:helix-hairpin-helix domain-containing protein [Kiritimatiellia bacterium]
APPPAAAPTVATTQPLNEVLDDFAAIQSLLIPKSESVRLPMTVLTKNLPAELRGPNWSAGGDPSGEIEVDRKNLISQLKKGRIVYKLGDISGDIPQGWIRGNSDALVELSLPDVVEALPDDFFSTQAQVSPEIIEAATMRDYFTPAGHAAAAAVPAASSTGASKTAPPHAPPRPPSPPERKKPRVLARPVAVRWDGIDQSPDAGPSVLDANTASVEDFLAIRGVGRVRAELIVRFREAQGPFQSIFDVAEIRGIGRRMFAQLTGLNAAPTLRRDRHEILNALIGLDAAARPTLQGIMDAMVTSLNARGAVLTGLDGISFAQSGSLGEVADRYAAVAPQFMRRSRHALKRLCGQPIHAVALPTSLPPLLMVTSASFVLILAMSPEVSMDDVVHRALMMTTELDWLLSPRLAVRADLKP